MRNPPREDLLEVVGCEIGKRPAQAPTMSDLGPHVVGVERRSDAITIWFAPEALAALREFVAAESHDGESGALRRATSCPLR